MIVPRNYA